MPVQGVGNGSNVRAEQVKAEQQAAENRAAERRKASADDGAKARAAENGRGENMDVTA